MKKLLQASVIVFSLFSFSSCVIGNHGQISDIDPQANGSVVTAEASGLGWLHLTAPSGMCETVVNELKSKGAVGNITTVTTTREWFGLCQSYKVYATGQKATGN